MKAMKKLFFTAAIFLFLISVGCRKESTPQLEPGVSYTGDWNFKVFGDYWNMDPFPTGTVWHDSTLYAGQIASGADSNELIVYYGKCEQAIVVVSEDGRIDSTYEKSGQFADTDHLTLILKSPQSWIGGGYTKTINGWR